MRLSFLLVYRNSLKKNLNASRPFEHHSPVKWEKMSTSLAAKKKTLLMLLVHGISCRGVVFAGRCTVSADTWIRGAVRPKRRPTMLFVVQACHRLCTLPHTSSHPKHTHCRIYTLVLYNVEVKHKSGDERTRHHRPLPDPPLLDSSWGNDGESCCSRYLNSHAERIPEAPQLLFSP